jgi:hypothetical protein
MDADVVIAWPDVACPGTMTAVGMDVGMMMPAGVLVADPANALALDTGTIVVTP